MTDDVKGAHATARDWRVDDEAGDSATYLRAKVLDFPGRWGTEAADAEEPLHPGPRRTERRGTGADADLRALAQTYGVRFSVFVAEEVDAAARLHTVGYEIELSGRARPLLQARYGRQAASLVHAALANIAEHALGRASRELTCRPTLLPPSSLDPARPDVRLRVGFYQHAHPLTDVAPRDQPCVRAVRERLAALGVGPID